MRIYFPLIILFLFFSNRTYSQDSEKYSIDIQVEGLQDSVIYLGNYFGDKRYYKDTSLVDDQGRLKFSKNSKLEKGVYFIYSKSFYLEFIVKEKQFSFSTTISDPYTDMKVLGSKENEIHRKFQMLMTDYQLNTRKVLGGLKDAASKEDSSSVYDQARDLADINRQQRDSLAAEHPGTYVAFLMHLMKNPQKELALSDDLTPEERRVKYYDFKSHYFDGIDFTDEGTIRSPIFHARVMDYMEKITFQHPDSIIASVDEILLKSEGNTEMYRYWMVFFFKKYQESKIMGQDKAFYHIAENYYLKGKATWADEEMLTNLEEEMDFHRENQMGMLAPRLYLVDTLLDTFSLRSISANYTILYFYRPSCGHCKKSTPVLLDAYHNLQLEGVEVLGVNVDTDIDEWKEFVSEFQLDWINAADPFTRSNFRRQFNVRSTPTIYVLDKDKRIIAKKLGVEQIEGFLADRIEFDRKNKM